MIIQLQAKVSMPICFTRSFADVIVFKSLYGIASIFYVAAKATYIRLHHGKIGFLGFFRP